MEGESGEITGILYLKTCYEAIYNAIYEFFANLSAIIINTVVEDIGYPDFKDIFKTFSWSFDSYNQTFQPYFEQMIGQFQFYTAFCSIILPILIVVSVFAYCCSSSEEYNDDEIDGAAARMRGTEQSHLMEAKRWHRQAVFDLQAAAYDIQQIEAAPEWTCFKCQQVDTRVHSFTGVKHFNTTLL